MIGMLPSLWKSRYGNCRAFVPSFQSLAKHWCCYHWETTSTDHDLEWHGKPGLFFCLLSSLQGVFNTENIVFQVRTLAQGFEAVKGGLGRACEVFGETGRRGCEQLSTKPGEDYCVKR